MDLIIFVSKLVLAAYTLSPRLKGGLEQRGNSELNGFISAAQALLKEKTEADIAGFYKGLAGDVDLISLVL
jgi:hypothetical protein